MAQNSAASSPANILRHHPDNFHLNALAVLIAVFSKFVCMTNGIGEHHDATKYIRLRRRKLSNAIRRKKFMDIKEIERYLPAVKQWINSTLQQHAYLAQPVISKGFQRLPSYFSEDILAQAKFVIQSPVPIPPFSKLGLNELEKFENSNYCGITYDKTFFLDECVANNESIFFHELVHVIQWQILGFDGFLREYAKGVIQRGYRDSPLEMMAYDAQQKFDDKQPPPIIQSFIQQGFMESYPDLG
jgi:hypothetical protein